MSIADNLKRVENAIEKACARAGRTRDEVRLVAVSKTKPVDSILEALRAGQMIFGENYVQEGLEKSRALPGAEWHFIGSLQTNKVKQISGVFELIHSVDRLKLAQEISKVASAAGREQSLLMQVHVGDEATKHGVSFSEAPALIEAILSLPGLRLRGLMALPPLTESEFIARKAFALVRESADRWRREFGLADFAELSMGTSSDYAWAIQEGATLVRVGTSIFGARE